MDLNHLICTLSTSYSSPQLNGFRVNLPGIEKAVPVKDSPRTPYSLRLRASPSRRPAQESGDLDIVVHNWGTSSSFNAFGRKPVFLHFKTGGHHRHLDLVLHGFVHNEAKITLGPTGRAAWAMVSAASFTSNMPKAELPVILIRMFLAPSIDALQQRAAVASRAAFYRPVVRRSPGRCPSGRSRRCSMMVRTSAKSEVDKTWHGDEVRNTLDNRGRNTSSAIRNASMREVRLSMTCRRRSLGMVMSVSHLAPQSARSAGIGLLRGRLSRSKPNGRVTTRTVSAFSSLAIPHTTGAPDRAGAPPPHYRRLRTPCPAPSTTLRISFLA